MTAILVLALLISAALTLLVMCLRDADARALALDIRPWGQLVSAKVAR